MVTYFQVMFLRGQGKSFSQIGGELEPAISKQRVQLIFTGRQQKVYAEYKKHYYTHKNFEEKCKYCIKEQDG